MNTNFVFSSFTALKIALFLRRTFYMYNNFCNRQHSRIRCHCVCANASPWAGKNEGSTVRRQSFLFVSFLLQQRWICSHCFPQNFNCCSLKNKCDIHFSQSFLASIYIYSVSLQTRIEQDLRFMGLVSVLISLPLVYNTHFLLFRLQISMGHREMPFKSHAYLYLETTTLRDHCFLMPACNNIMTHLSF